jgi:PAS domain S-box-containing protein
LPTRSPIKRRGQSRLAKKPPARAGRPNAGASPATKAARMPNADFRMLANALPQIIWTCSAAGVLEWVNDRWTEVTGLGLEASLRPKGALEAVHPEDRGPMQERFADALAASAPCEIEYRIRDRQGRYRYHLARVSPVRREDGSIQRWIAATFDVHARREAEEALRLSERRFEAVFQLSPQPTAITRAKDGACLHVNDALLEMTGFARGEFVGKTAVELGLWAPEARVHFLEHVDDESHAPPEVQVVRKDGAKVRTIVRAAAIDFGGEPCIITTAMDVTEQRRVESALRESEACARARADELTTLTEAVPAMVLIAQDPECREVRTNHTGREILRMGATDNVSKTAYDPEATRHFTVFIDGVEVPAGDLPLQRAARGEEVRENEQEIRFDDGQVVHLFGSVVPLRDTEGAPRGSIGAFVDVTRLKRAEAAMREADRRKDEFLALLSHELRNPLAPILNAAELIRSGPDGGRSPEGEVILRQSRHLQRLVDDLLEVSRVATGKVTLSRRPLDVGSVISRAIEATRPLFEQQRHSLAVELRDDELVVDADEVRLTQVVSNLLSNAARYTPSGGHVWVKAARQGAEVVVEVRDDGVGIDASLLPHVFETFVQGARGPDRAQGGLGLGLSLVQSLTALHGGTVEARSDGPYRGSTFTVRLPAAGALHLAADDVEIRAPRRARTAQLRRVLIVDDNRDGAEMVSYLLTRAGHEVRVAHDPEQALLALDGFRPHVAILDIGLPIMDGYTLGRELRARLADAPPVLVALSGYGQEHDKAESKRAGFAHHLSKPVDADTLVDVVTSVAD